MKSLTEINLQKLLKASKSRHLNIDRPTELVNFTTTTTPPQTPKIIDEPFPFPKRVDYSDHYDRTDK